MYYIGIHDNPLFIKLDINTTHFMICSDVRYNLSNSIIYPKIYHTREIQDFLVVTYNDEKIKTPF